MFMEFYLCYFMYAAFGFTLICSMPQLGCYFDITKKIIQNMNQYIVQNNGQRLSLESQVEENPVKKVSNSSHQTTPKKLTANDLLGLSWVLFEEKED